MGKGQMKEEAESDEFEVISSAGSLLCPLTKKEIRHAVKSEMCGHVFEKQAIVRYIAQKEAEMDVDDDEEDGPVAPCPVSGCAESIMEGDLVPVNKTGKNEKSDLTTQGMQVDEDEEDESGEDRKVVVVEKKSPAPKKAAGKRKVGD